MPFFNPTRNYSIVGQKYIEKINAFDSPNTMSSCRFNPLAHLKHVFICLGQLNVVSPVLNHLGNIYKTPFQIPCLLTCLFYVTKLRFLIHYHTSVVNEMKRKYN